MDRHSANVSEYTRTICVSMGLDEQLSRDITRAAALHDIGKVYVPERILTKKAALTDDEYREVKKHVSHGYRLLYRDDDPFFKMAALVALEHHERMDGSGYMGLEADEISFPARIVAVADVFDALVTERSYKDSWGFEKAFDYICLHKRDLFDCDVVTAFAAAQNKIYRQYLKNSEIC